MSKVKYLLKYTGPIIDPPRFVEWIEMDENDNVISKEHIYGNKTIKII